MGSAYLERIFLPLPDAYVFFEVRDTFACRQRASSTISSWFSIRKVLSGSSFRKVMHAIWGIFWSRINQ